MRARQEIATLRLLIEERDRLYEERRQSDIRTREAETAAYAKHFEGLNGARGMMADMTSQMISRREHDGQIAGLSETIERNRVMMEARLTADYEPLRAKVELAAQPNWALMTSLLSIVLVLAGGAWLVMGLKIDSAISPVQLAVEQNKVALAAQGERVRVVDTASQASAQADQVSRVDRAQLNDRVRTIEGTQQGRTQSIADVSNLKVQYQVIVDRLQQIRSENTKQAAALIEVETQFCEEGHLRNLNHATELRTTALLWQRVFGENYPIGSAYFPQVCNRPGAVQQSGGGQ